MSLLGSWFGQSAGGIGQPVEISLVEQIHEPSDAEKADAKKWAKRIKEARRGDREARKRYAIDRRYARGDCGGFEVGVPIAGSYIDVLRSYLYARNPDLDCMPADAVQPPSEQQIKESMGFGLLPAASALAQLHAQASKEAVQQVMVPYRERLRKARALGQTLQIVERKLWGQADLKDHMLLMVGSMLTVGIGWIKCTWQEERAEDPVVRGQIDGLTAQMQRIAATLEEAEDRSEPEAAMAEVRQQVMGLQEKLHYVQSRGLAIDFIPAQDIQVAPGPVLSRYQDAAWIAERFFREKEEAKAQFAELGDRLDAATLYYRKEPHLDHDEVGILADLDESDADEFSSGGGGEECPYIAGWEVWDRLSGVVLTLIDGVEGYAREPYTPDPCTRQFYPYVQCAPLVVAGERHPQSLVTRSQPLLDEYNRVRSAFAETRRRAIPAMFFDERVVNEADAAKMASAGNQELVGISPNIPPGTPLANVLVPKSYARVDMGLYDTAPIRAELEMIWGIQEALSSSIAVAKTATESEIEQQGTQSRLGYMRSAIDHALQQISDLTAEIALAKMDQADVKRMAGPWAWWPQEPMDGNALDELVLVKVRAGSSGPPDTTAERNAWTASVPILKEAITDMAALLHSDPEDVASCIEAVVEETLGEHIDAERFLPGPPDNPQPSNPSMPAPGMPAPAASPVPQLPLPQVPQGMQ